MLVAACYIVLTSVVFNISNGWVICIDCGGCTIEPINNFGGLQHIECGGLMCIGCDVSRAVRVGVAHILVGARG